MTRSPFGRKNCVYLMGGSTGAAFAAAAPLAPPLLPFCASAVSVGANSNAATSAASRRLQRIVKPPYRLGEKSDARPRAPDALPPICVIYESGERIICAANSISRGVGAQRCPPRLGLLESVKMMNAE